MKLFIITISECCDYEEMGHKPVVKATIKEAKAYLEKIYQQVRKELVDDGSYDHVDKGEKSFSLFPEGCWPEYHYDACIDEVEITLPAPASTIREQMEAHRLEFIENMKAAIAALVEEKAPGADGYVPPKPVNVVMTLETSSAVRFAPYAVKTIHRDGTLVAALPNQREYEYDLDLLSLDELYNVAQALEL